VSEMVMGERYDHGAWLVVAEPGSVRSRRIDPAHAEVEAAMMVAEKAMVAAMNEANQYKRDRPHYHKPLTRVQRKALAEFNRQFPARLLFDGCSMHDVVQAGLDAVRREMRGGEDGA